ncbi:MAG TPA: GNAT family N-acetyltransferase [Acidocella sp.]|nr:GNAT family N-acetyltransferase [Acidocella sp.]
MIKASLAHAGVMAALHGAVFPEDPWDEANFAALFQQNGVSGLLDPRGGFVLFWLVADEASVITLGVVPKRQGIGRALLAAGLQQMREAGAVMIYLEVAATNMAARKLYEGFGFQQTGLRKKYYTDGDDAVTMSLGL